MRGSLIKNKGFTLLELLIVVAIIMILASLLLPALARGRTMARKASCASNMKQWGTAIAMYLSDFNDYWFTNANAWSNVNNPICRNLVGTDSGSGTRYRRMRNCPAYTGLVPPDFINNVGPVTYAFCRPNGNNPDGWGTVTINNGNSYTWKTIAKPAQFLLMIDGPNARCNGGSIFLVHCAKGSCITAPCNDFYELVTENCMGNLAPLARHMGGVNVMFGDFHVDFKPLTELSKHANYGTLDGWFASDTPSDPTVASGIKWD